MKTSLALALGLFVVTSSFAQGTINFFNNNLTGPNGTYRAGIFVEPGTGPGGNAYGIFPRTGAGLAPGGPYTVGLFSANDLNTPLATTTFRNTTAPEVFVQTVPDVPIPGAPAGSTATLVVRAWQTSAGSYNNSAIRGEQFFTSRALGGPNPDPTQPAIPSPDLGPGFTGFTMFVPEPSTIGLAVLGLGLLIFRRQKSSNH